MTCYWEELRLVPFGSDDQSSHLLHLGIVKLSPENSVVRNKAARLFCAIKN